MNIWRGRMLRLYRQFNFSGSKFWEELNFPNNRCIVLSCLACWKGLSIIVIDPVRVIIFSVLYANLKNESIPT